jgi:hypothetical protein
MDTSKHFFQLHGVNAAEKVVLRKKLPTFPIVEREGKAACDGRYRSCEFCLAWMSALAAGDPDADIRL